MKGNESDGITGSILESAVAKVFFSRQNLDLFYPTKSITKREANQYRRHYFTFQSSITDLSINRSNDFAILQLEKKFTDKLLDLIATEDFEYGVISKSEILVKEQLKNNSAATKLWLNSIYLRNFKSPEILIGILRIISRFPQKTFEPIGHTVAIASLAHKNEEVVETAIRVFENWGGVSSLDILQSVQINSKWLDDYRNAVVKDIQSELCLS
jgi:hypothetical protein